MRRPPPRVIRGRPADAAARWLVAVPAWGERCARVAQRYTLPALAEALRPIQRPVKLIVWSDQSGLQITMPEGVSVAVRRPPGPDLAFESLSECHREALAEAGPSDRVLLLTADMVLSREILATCEDRVSRGYRLVCCAAMRALEDARPPIGATGRQLLDWAWTNRHPMTRECTWPDGRSMDVWRMYFEKGGEVAARVFLPHPLVAVTGGRPLAFRPTIDVNLAANFAPSQTCMITQPTEGAVVEVSPADKHFDLAEPMHARMIGGPGAPSCPTFTRCSHPRHRMFFNSRVVIRGSGGDCGDAEAVGRFLS